MDAKYFKYYSLEQSVRLCKLFTYVQNLTKGPLQKIGKYWNISAKLSFDPWTS